MMRKQRAIYGLALAFGLECAGCVYTTAGTKLPPINPPPPSFQPAVEDTVGDFDFTLEGGAMISAKQAGKIFNKGIMDAWKQRGYIREATPVESATEFSNTADYHVVLSGTQYSESSILLQIISGLTLTIVPYTVTQNYDVQYMVEDTKSGRWFSASVQDSNTAYVELFLLFALPWGGRGQDRLMATMADYLFTQLHDQGAFSSPPDAPAVPESPPPSP